MPDLEFRIMYQLKNAPGRTVYTNSIRSGTVSEILQKLGREVQLNTLTAQQLVVHWIKPNGEVVEVLDFDASKGHKSFSYFEPQAIQKLGGKVVPISTAATKPRVRLKSVPATHQTVSYGRYTIREAK